MNIDFSQLDTADIYRTMAHTLVPRPIAWVLSDNGDNSFNLAPFSYFSAVSSDPPLIMLSVGKKRDGTFKDTRVNIQQRQDFVVHIASVEHIDSLNASAASLAFADSEISQLQLETSEFPGSRLPRLRDCKIAYACRLWDLREIGSVPMSMILGEIKSVYIDDRIIAQESGQHPQIDPLALDPLARLGGTHYASLGEIHSRRRPE
jgi:flavin reductase (DIM6/NTAB) family NADH-FMN oxidoreductase RutF